MGQRSEDQMDKKELQRETAKLRRLYGEFPFLSQLVTKWHPEYVDIGIYTMKQSDWLLIRRKNNSTPFPPTSEVKIWFKIKARKGETIYDAFVPYSSLEESYNYDGVVARFRQWYGSLDLQQIEYIVEETTIKTSGRKIILVFRPPKGQKIF
jgi:hypothetical protein